MKKLLLALLGLLLVVFVGASIYVATIDWNEHKNVIAEQFSAATGKKIVFEGPVSFKLLPTPYLNASNVKILNPAGGEKSLVEIPDLVAKLSLIPLLKGQFNVQRMELKNPQINIEVLEGGKLNWQSDLTPEQRRQIEEAKIALNSASISDATLNFEDPFRNIVLKLENLNGEIVAQSIMGPYRIEGNYIKDNSPEGFAISMGQISDSFSTTLNLAVTHPSSESFVRFDGRFMLTNKVLSGNLIVESKKLKQFLQANFKQLEVNEVYDAPLAVTADVDVNEQQFNLSNIVVKYGNTQGAGNLQMPFNDGFGNGGVKPRIDVAFNFTDLDLNPVVYSISSLIKKYSLNNSVYAPQTDFDLLADVKSVRTVYNGQQIKNFETSVDWVENILTLNNVGLNLPGDTEVRLKGMVSAFEEKPFYSIDASLNSDDFLKTLTWLEINPEVSAAATYRKATGEAKFIGNLQRIQISPFKFTLDKSSVSGEVGIKLDTPRKDIMLTANTDMINFDNYIGALPDEEKVKTWAQRMSYRFSKLGILNDFDMQAKVKMNLGIYESIPFENVYFEGNLLNEKLEVKQLQIGAVANSKIEMSGMVSGFGKSPVFENFNYNLQTNDVASLISKIGIEAPNLDYKKLNDFQMLGAITGSLSDFATQTNMTLKDLNLAYSGQVSSKEGKTSYNGDLEVKHPDFVKMLNSLNFAYDPQTYSLGLFNLKTTINGNVDEFRAAPLVFNIGFNTFEGDISYQVHENNRPSILTNLDINKFEIERFLNRQNSADGQPAFSSQGDKNTSFLAKPIWSKNQINYDFYNSFDLSGNFKINDLSYQKYNFTQVQTDISVLQGNVDVKNFAAKYLGGDVTASLQLQMQKDPRISGKITINNAEINQLNSGGEVYALNNGVFNTKLSFSSSANSEYDFISGMKANTSFDFANTNVKGWNFQAIYDDILKRELPDGLAVVVRNATCAGNTPVSRLKGRAEVVDGEFAFVDTNIVGNNFTAGVSGDGNLAEWTMNVLFSVKYGEPKYLPGFSFSLKGPIASPLLDVDVSSLFDLYKTRQDKREADIRAAEDAEKSRLKMLAEEQKKTSETLLAEIRNKLEPEINDKQSKAVDSEANVKYAQIKQQLGTLAADLAANSMRADKENIDEDLLKQLEKVNNNAAAEMEKQRQLLADAYLIDIRKNIQLLYSQVIEIYNKSKMLDFEYNAAKEGFGKRLLAIQTDFDLEKDDNITGWQNFIEDKISAFEQQDKKLLDDVQKMQKTTNADEATEYQKQLANLKDVLTVDLRDMEQSFTEYKDYTEKKVAAQEEAYAVRLREEEVQRKLEENTGSISIKKSGKTLTVRRDIEDIEKAEELANEQEIRVLDFSRPKVKVETKTPSSNVNVVKKGRVKLN